MSEQQQKAIEEITGYVTILVKALAESHGITAILITSLRCTPLSPAQEAIIATAAQELARSQNEFLKTFGDWAEPGTN
jgi:hypothetical protein